MSTTSTGPEGRTTFGGPIVVGVLLVIAGAVWLLGNLGLLDVSFGLVGSLLLTGLGVALVVWRDLGHTEGWSPWESC